MCMCGKHTMALLEARDNIVVPFPPFPFTWRWSTVCQASVASAFPNDPFSQPQN